MAVLIIYLISVLLCSLIISISLSIFNIEKGHERRLCTDELFALNVLPVIPFLNSIVSFIILFYIMYQLKFFKYSPFVIMYNKIYDYIEKRYKL